MKNNPQYFSQSQIKALKSEQSVNETKLMESLNNMQVFRNL